MGCIYQYWFVDVIYLSLRSYLPFLSLLFPLLHLHMSHVTYTVYKGGRSLPTPTLCSYSNYPYYQEHTCSIDNGKLGSNMPLATRSHLPMVAENGPNMGCNFLFRNARDNFVSDGTQRVTRLGHLHPLAALLHLAVY